MNGNCKVSISYYFKILIKNKVCLMNFKPANIPSNDALRVKAVQRTGVLDEHNEELYQIYCFLAKEITGCPVSWTGVIDSEKQFVLARDGFPDEVPMEMPRDQTLCQFAIEKTEPLIINDMTIDYRFKNHPAVVDFGVKFYAAFPVTTSDGYTLGTLCVSDNRVRRLTKNKIKLLKGLASKLSYQLEVQVNQRKGTAESVINILNKLTGNFNNLQIKEAISILKFLIKEQISKDDEDLLIQFGIAHKKNDVLELSSQGKNLKSELNLNIGTLKRIKNLSSDNEQLMNMLDQIKG